MTVEMAKSTFLYRRAARLTNPQITSALQDLEVAARDAGLHVTAGALNNAARAAGLEMAGDVEAAEMAAVGKLIRQRKPKKG